LRTTTLQQPGADEGRLVTRRPATQQRNSLSGGHPGHAHRDDSSGRDLAAGQFPVDLGHAAVLGMSEGIDQRNVVNGRPIDPGRWKVGGVLMQVPNERKSLLLERLCPDL
jgi:hypothetical protein